MNVSIACMKALQTNSRSHRVALLVMVGVVVMVATGAQYFGAGDTLRTPVQIKSPSDTILITIDDKGVLEFHRGRQIVARLSGLSLHETEDTLERMDGELRKIDQTLQQQHSMLDAHERLLKIVEGHMRHPVYRLPGQ